MATLLKDDGGIPIPQYANAQGDFESSHGADGAIYVKDAQLATILDRVSNIMNEVERHGVSLGTIKDDVADMKVAIASIANAMTTIVNLLEAPLQDITRDVADIPEPAQSSGGGE